MSTYFEIVEGKISELVVTLSSEFTQDEKQEIARFVDVGEYGLALETLVDIVAEENKNVTGSSTLLIFELVDLMKLNRSAFSGKLKSR